VHKDLQDLLVLKDLQEHKEQQVHKVYRVHQDLLEDLTLKFYTTMEDLLLVLVD
jgi:hypothetical protein